MTTRLLVFATPREGMDAEYNQWYDEVHIPEMLEIPGVVSGERHRLVRGGAEFEQYLSVFVVEGDPGAVLAELGARSADGRMTMSPAVDPQHTKVTIWDSL